MSSQVLVYDKVETYDNCTVQILTDSKTGNVSVGWWKNEEQPVEIGGSDDE